MCPWLITCCLVLKHLTTTIQQLQQTARRSQMTGRNICVKVYLIIILLLIITYTAAIIRLHHYRYSLTNHV